MLEKNEMNETKKIPERIFGESQKMKWILFPA